MSRRRELATAALPPVVTALCLAMGLAEVAAGKWPPATPIAVAWAVATALPVLAVRTHPIAAWLTEVALTVPLVPLLGQPKSGALFFEDATLLIGLGIGVSSRRRLAWLAFTVVGVVAVITASDHDQPTAGARVTELLVTTLLFLGFVGIGCLVAWRSRADRAAHEDEQRARAESDAEVGRVLSDERARIARDLHDVVAHSVSLMVVQAVGGRAMLDRDPPRALAALDAIDRAGAQALAELARMVEVLADPEPGERPGLARLAALVDGARTLGSEVSLETTGPVDRLPAGVDVAAYRIVQEAVTNGVKHSRGRLAVRVVVDSGVVRLEVSSPLAAPAVPVTGGGYGLLGMRERAALYGGTVDAGPVDGAWVVRAMLPLTATVAVS